MVGDTLATDKGLTFSGGLKLGSGAKLQLNDAMMEKIYNDGDIIQAFTGTVTGQFSEILPATPGEGQTWDTTELYTNGRLKVVGGALSGISTLNDGTPERIEYFTMSGERVKTPGKGLYVVRATTAEGKVISRKISQ